jgi:hypothetical protein
VPREKGISTCVKSQSTIPACLFENPNRLVSLWEIVKSFDAGMFVELTRVMGWFETTDHIASLAHQRGVDVSEYITNEERRSNIDSGFSDLENSCIELGLTASLATIRKLRRKFVIGCKDSDIYPLTDELQGRLSDELKGRSLWSLTVREGEYYNKPLEGWREVIDRFPATITDVEEMNKCFALCRYTASIFHALQVAELGAIELGIYIGVTDPKKGWGATEKKLREIMKFGHSNLPSQLVGKFEFLEQMSREIDSMTLAWRHKVDHAANRLAVLPNTDFTPDIAEHIIGAVRVYMLRMADGVP